VVRYLFIAPTFGAMDMSLSLRTTMRVPVGVPGVVQRLIGESASHRPVSDDRDDLLVPVRAGPVPAAIPSAAEIEVAA
jgi:hypothetical protein